jgi:hypothetical protein
MDTVQPSLMSFCYERRTGRLEVDNELTEGIWPKTSIALSFWSAWAKANRSG